jgi:pyridoxamine 5'-phosphate oxidase
MKPVQPEPLFRPPLLEADLDPSPIRQFELWLDAAVAANLREPYAMTLATADEQGRPSARTVLLRGFDERGFCFFTNYESRKGKELAVNPRACLVFYWAELERQVRIDGTVEFTLAADSDAYFLSRPRDSRLGAWASPQSEVIPGRTWLEGRMAELEKKYLGQPVPRPPHWGGYRVVPEALEFWQGQPGRLHDRLVYVRRGSTWEIRRLSP